MGRTESVWINITIMNKSYSTGIVLEDLATNGDLPNSTRDQNTTTNCIILEDYNFTDTNWIKMLQMMA